MVCSKCFQGAVHDHAQPAGRVEQMYGYPTYITGDKEATSDSAILYLPYFFSHKLVNNKLLADRYAQGTGCKVLFPDIVYKGGVDPSVMPHFERVLGPMDSIWTFFQKVWSVLCLLPIAPAMMIGGASKAFPEVLRYAREMKADMPRGAKLGVCGFCWGGYGSTNLCLETSQEGGSERLIDAQFCGHPSALKTPDMIVGAITKYKVPYSVAVAEVDFMYNEKAALETEAVLRKEVGTAEENDYEQIIYKGANHGFCVRAKVGHEKDNDGYHKAAKQAVDWFNKYLK